MPAPGSATLTISCAPCCGRFAGGQRAFRCRTGDTGDRKCPPRFPGLCRRRRCCCRHELHALSTRRELFASCSFPLDASGTRPSLARSGLPGSGGTSVAASCHRSSAGVDEWKIGALARAPWRPATPLPLDSAHYDCGRLARRLPYRVHGSVCVADKKSRLQVSVTSRACSRPKKDRRDPIPTVGVAGGSALGDIVGSSLGVRVGFTVGDSLGSSDGLSQCLY